MIRDRTVPSADHARALMREGLDLVIGNEAIEAEAQAGIAMIEAQPVSPKPLAPPPGRSTE